MKSSLNCFGSVTAGSLVYKGKAIERELRKDEGHVTHSLPLLSSKVYMQLLCLFFLINLFFGCAGSSLLGGRLSVVAVTL